MIPSIFLSCALALPAEGELRPFEALGKIVSIETVLKDYKRKQDETHAGLDAFLRAFAAGDEFVKSLTRPAGRGWYALPFEVEGERIWHRRKGRISA